MAVQYFPTLHQDEIIYSAIARYGAVMEYSSDRVLLRELFGDTNLIATIGLPSRLDDLIRLMPRRHPYTAEQLIFEHTDFPFYSPFLPLERYHQVMTDMRRDRGGELYTRLGIMASRVRLPVLLRYCPNCVATERRLHQDGCYWHRLHQLPGVLLCPDHHTILVNSSVPVFQKRTRYAFIAAESAIPQNEPNPADRSEQPYKNHLRRIVLDTTWLLNHRGAGPGLTWLHERYQQLMIQTGLATYSGRVHIRELLAAFQTHYSSELLALLHCELAETISDNWLLRLVRKPQNSQHPLHNLLLIHFLGHTVESFFQSQAAPGYFGPGPWPCLNSVCQHYRQAVINQCEIHYSCDARRPVGRFVCECGFVYQRVGPDEQPEDMFRWSEIETFGPVWDSALRRLWPDPAVSLRGLARELGVTTRTVNRHAVRLGLSFPRPNSQGGRKPTLKDNSIQRGARERQVVHQTTWLVLREQYPAEGVTELRRRCPATYSWLYRYDRAWLERQRPKPKGPPQGIVSQVNWPERDLSLAVDCLGAALRLLQSQGRPRQLTVTAMAREAGQLAVIQQHPAKLPLTSALLTRLVEARLPFAIRRIDWAKAYFRQAGIVPQPSELVRQSGTHRLKETPEVEQALTDVLNSLQVLSRMTIYKATSLDILGDIARQIKKFSISC